ncbi:unnamed protein product [Blepharisma stoltei]|uniref:Transmembrane protein n=1 Tax=Blepharisma stoltei TaxID=1481888 RepID=A0AAU9ITF4_9CILI|nr:unnamed protein product [Blepharisma stoltei]
MNLFDSIDLYKTQHNHVLETPMLLKKTRIGGIFSLIFLILAVMIIISILIDYSINNEIEIKSLVPLVVMNHEVSKFVTDLKVLIKAIRYPCVDDYGNCADTISLSTNKFAGNWDKMICINSDLGCELSLNCHSCEIGTGA